MILKPPWSALGWFVRLLKVAACLFFKGGGVGRARAFFFLFDEDFGSRDVSNGIYFFCIDIFRSICNYIY